MSGYSLEGLKHGVERAEHNIRVLTAAIATERQTIKDYERMIQALERTADRRVVVMRDAAES